MLRAAKKPIATWKCLAINQKQISRAMNPGAHNFTFAGQTMGPLARLNGCEENLNNMTAKSLFIAGALTLSSLSVASAKSFDVVLNQRAMAGNTELKAGDY